MKVTGSLTSTRFGTSTPPRNIESNVHRVGDHVSAVLCNNHGDVIRASMNASGDISVTVERDGKLIENFTAPKHEEATV